MGKGPPLLQLAEVTCRSSSTGACIQSDSMALCDVTQEELQSTWEFLKIRGLHIDSKW